MNLIAKLISKLKSQLVNEPTQEKDSPTITNRETDTNRIAEELSWLEKWRKEHLDTLDFWSKQTNAAKNVRDMHALNKYIGKEVIVETIDLWDRRCCIFENPEISKGVLKSVLPFESMRVGIHQPEIYFSRIPFREKPIGPIRKITDDHDKVIYFNPLIRRSLAKEPLLFHRNAYISAISFGWINYFKYQCKDGKRAKILGQGIRLNIPEMEMGEHLYRFAQTPFGIAANEQALRIIRLIKQTENFKEERSGTIEAETQKKDMAFWQNCQKIQEKLSQEITIKAIFKEEAKGNRMNTPFLEKLAGIFFTIQFSHPKGAAMYQGFKSYRNIFD
jgi:hypothetical protein